jgi:hypothetical protein
MDIIQTDFAFVVSGARFPSVPIIARLIASKVCFLNAVDPSICEYAVETKDSSGQFGLFLSLSQSSCIEVGEVNFPFFVSLSREVGNLSVYDSILKYFKRGFPCPEIFESTYLNVCTKCSIQFLAAEFYRLTPSVLDRIPVSTLYHILSHDMIRVSNEDALYSYLESRIRVNPEYFDLLQFVRFEYLSLDSHSRFPSMLPKYINRRLWDAIFCRMIQHPAPGGLEFPFKAAKARDGVISYLTRR